MARGIIELGFLFNSTKDIDNIIIDKIKNEIEFSLAKVKYIYKEYKDSNHILIYFCMDFDSIVKDVFLTEKEYIDELYKVEDVLISFVKNVINNYYVDYIYIDSNSDSDNDKYLLEDVLKENTYTIICYYTDKFNIRFSPWLLDGLRERNSK